MEEKLQSGDNFLNSRSSQNGNSHQNNRPSSVNNSIFSSKKQAFSTLISQKRCDYNCSSCQNQKEDELYPGATPPPQISLNQTPPKSLNFPSAFGDYQANSAPPMMPNPNAGQFWGNGFGGGGMNNPSSGSLGNFGNPMFQSPGMTGGGMFPTSGVNSAFPTQQSMFQQQNPTEPRYPSPFLGSTFSGNHQASPANHFSQFKQSQLRPPGMTGTGGASFGQMGNRPNAPPMNKPSPFGKFRSRF